MAKSIAMGFFEIFVKRNASDSNYIQQAVSPCKRFPMIPRTLKTDHYFRQNLLKIDFSALFFALKNVKKIFVFFLATHEADVD